MVKVLGIKIDTLSIPEAHKRLVEFFVDGKQHLLATPNPEILLAARENKKLADALNVSDLNMPDGFGLWLVMRLRGARGARFPGVEISEEIMRLAQEKKETVYFLGNEKRSAEKAATKFPDAQIIAEAGPDFRKGDTEVAIFSQELIARINSMQPSVVFAAFGHTKQEIWLHEYLSQMPSVKIAIGVGGTFDFWSGVARRAPKFLRILGLEWIWRLILEPKRWKRIFNAVIVFPLRVLVERHFW
jgi:N-acetylglucosaminyldiphosphoundecaprenol N-acetyl-beta-D-mannosaminyltransferase